MIKFPSTSIAADIDFEDSGKHFGYFRIPHSVHRSAYGWLPMPVISIRNGEGPRVLLMSGNHGDEYEGQITLTKLARTLQPESIRGHLLILPMANYPAAHAGRRTSPIDGGNLNRSFPGDPNGTITEKIAHLIEEELLGYFELLIDLHSGGSSLLYLPSTQVLLNKNGSIDSRERELVDAYGAPFNHIIHSYEDTDSGAASRRKGTLFLASEFGGAGTVTPEALRLCENGLFRTLTSFGSLLLQTPDFDKPRLTRYLEIKNDKYYVYTSEDGLYEPLVELGDEVKSGDAAGVIHFPDTPQREPLVEFFNENGVVVCKRIPGRVQRGDCMFHLASDWQG